MKVYFIFILFFIIFTIIFNYYKNKYDKLQEKDIRHIFLPTNYINQFMIDN